MEIGSKGSIKSNGISGNVSQSNGNLNTEGTNYQNGNFVNVNEVHNNTGSMIISGFNQDGGKLIGNIGKVEVTSKQNTSTTTGSSKGMSVGVSSQGIPTSVNLNASKTNGNRNFVDNQSSFTVGEGSNLQVETLENTGAIIGKQSENATFKIDNYVGKNLQNDDEMKTTGGAIGVSTGKPKVTSLEFSQDSRDKEGVTRNTVVGNVEIGQSLGDEINRDLNRANEITKDSRSSTNVSVESQTIEYASDPTKLKEDLGKAKKEISDVTKAVKESINDRGDDNRNFFGQLREVRLSETVNNIAGKRLTEAEKSEDVVSAWKDAYKDLGYNLDVKYTTGEDTPEMKNKAGTAYISESGVHTIILNINAEENQTKAGLIGTLAEEASHIVNGVAGRQIETGTEEKGLESTGRAANAYFKEEYKGSKQGMTYKSDGKIDTSRLGVHVGDRLFLDASLTREEREELLNYVKANSEDELKEECNSNGCEIEIVKNGKKQGNVTTGTKLIREILEDRKKVTITNETGEIGSKSTRGSNYDPNTGVLTFDRKQRAFILVENLSTKETYIVEQNKISTMGHELVHVHNDMKHFTDQNIYYDNKYSWKMGTSTSEALDGFTKQEIINERVNLITGKLNWDQVSKISEIKEKVIKECKGKKECDTNEKFLSEISKFNETNKYKVDISSLSEFNNLERKASSEKKFIEKQLEKYCNAERCVSAEELATSGIGKQWNKQITNENILTNELKNRFPELKEKGLINQNINQEDLNYRRVMYFSPIDKTFNGLKILEIKKDDK